MLSSREIEAFYCAAPGDLLEIVMELRSLICKVTPNITEIIQWKGLSYFDSARGGSISAGVCQIFVATDHVRLAFVHGINLPDPQQLLEGSGKAKRFVRLADYASAPWPALEDLIRASAHFDPRTQQFFK
jgi:Uncharacterized conserved protein